ncbi:efflux RND transporter periplasmic adaptor subunit [Agrobacterium tumefaciens]|uniref:efflux RND transporter periplasmic adaptor subunit n=1 Tax=Agrobacterium tumefaciens TaxID=358 RepID=UPI00129AEA05|nr:efflux RND transporter periplasmic adaptor subunit [Agrobacterium tumefaciens]MRH98634.1 efflux RND transporter periplasmic adaptor subunit [Agrobacterium tumefaciens]
MDLKLTRGFGQRVLLAAPLVIAPLAAAAQQPPLPAVTVTVVQATDYTLTARLPGRIKASTEAEVRPQVSGIIRERLFDEGVRVKKGQALYKIDDDNYASATQSAKAALAEAQANFDLAVIDARRAAELLANRSGTASNRDSTAAQQSRADAALQRARAQLTTAEIDLNRTTIRAPIDGVIGFSETTPGALVAAQQATALATIRTINPVNVDVTQSATDLFRWQSKGGANGLEKSAMASLILPDGSRYPLKGKLTAAEPKVEPTTGMVTLRVSFENPGQVLLPGLYVEVELPQAKADGAILVPQSSVMRNAQGEPYVWVVKDSKIEERPLSIFTADGNQLVITDGLAAGERVVTSGFQKAAPGAEVTVEVDSGNPAVQANESK